MIYLLDTCVVSDFIKGDVKTLRHIQKKSPNEIAISAITSMEISYGLALHPEKKKKIQPMLNDFMKVISVLPFEERDAVCCGEIRAYLKQHGMQIGSYDVLLAGVALNRGLILVSSNLKEFMRVKDLHTENWRE